MTHSTVTAAGLFLRRTHRGSWQWLLLSNKRRKDWGFPKGHSEAGESHFETALRECAEETGIGLIAATGDALSISYPVKNNRQKTVYYFPAITAQHSVSLSKEHIAGEWCDAKTVLKRLPHENIRKLFREHLNSIRS